MVITELLGRNIVALLDSCNIIAHFIIKLYVLGTKLE